ncbi:coatomer subunit beta-1 [Tanacetum coccineum]
MVNDRSISDRGFRGDVDLKLLSKQEYSHDLILAFRLEVSIQKVQGSFDKSDGSDNASQHDRSLMTYFGTIDLERSISSRRTSIGSDIMLSRSNSNSGFNTPKNVKLTKDRSLQWDWINSTEESSTSTLEGTSKEDSLDAERYLLVTMVVVNTVIQDEKEFLNNIIKSNNMKCLTTPSALEGDCGFLAANLYAKSVFGEDTLVNLSIEKQGDGKLSDIT